MGEKFNINIVRKVKLKNGKELILRKAIANDSNSIIEYLNIVGGESNNLLFGKGEFKVTVEQEREYIENINSMDDSLMLLGVLEGKIVSVAQIVTTNRKRIAHNSEIAISVKREYWGIGIGGKVISELIKFAKESIIIKNISLGVRSDNHNAIKLYEKYGFEKVGVHKNYFNIEGKYYDEILMDLNLEINN